MRTSFAALYVVWWVLEQWRDAVGVIIVRLFTTYRRLTLWILGGYAAWHALALTTGFAKGPLINLWSEALSMVTIYRALLVRVLFYPDPLISTVYFSNSPYWPLYLTARLSLQLNEFDLTQLACAAAVLGLTFTYLTFVLSFVQAAYTILFRELLGKRGVIS